MFNFFKKKESKPAKQINIGKGKILLTLLDGSVVEGTTREGFISNSYSHRLAWKSLGEDLAQYTLETQSAKGLFHAADGTFIPREQVKSARIERSDFFITEKE